MSYNQLSTILVIFSLISCSLQDTSNNKVDTQEESPFADIAKEFTKDKNMEDIGGMVNSFIQSGGAKQIMDGVLQNLAASANSGQLLESLGSMLKGASNKKSADEVNSMDLISGLGTLMGAMQGAGGNDGEASSAGILQGLGSVLAGADGGKNGDGAAVLMQGLGSILSAASKNDGGRKGEGGDSAGALLQGIGSLMGATAGDNQGKDGDSAGAILQGLGSLLSAGGNKEGGGIDPEMIGNMINMFTQTQEKEPVKKSSKKASEKKSNAKKTEKLTTKSKKTNNKLEGVFSLAGNILQGLGTSKDTGDVNLDLIFENFPLILKLARNFGGPTIKQYLEPIEDLVSAYQEIAGNKKNVDYKKLAPCVINLVSAYKKLLSSKSKNKEEQFDMGSLMSLAGSFLNQANSGKSGANLMEYLPMIMNTINAFTGQEAQDREGKHAKHSWSLPSVMEKLHIYFDHFLNSDIGKELYKFLDSQKTFDMFRNEKGNFDYDKFEGLIENHSFRKHWIQQFSKKLVELLQKVSDEKTQKEYIEMGTALANSMLQGQGFPKKSLLDPRKPVKSISNFANYAAKKYLEAEIDSREYVEPIVAYVQDILKMAKAPLASKELSDKLTDTLNMEIIEPITRTNRAYRFAKSQPACDSYVFCVINQEKSRSHGENLPKLKSALHKGTSLIASWFVSSHTGTSYWDLYAAITDGKNCQKYLNETCSAFHEEEIRATTEYIHTEL